VQGFFIDLIVFTNKIKIMIDKINLTILDIQDGVNQFACNAPKFDCIVGIARGGLIPAALLSYKLDIKDLYTIQLSSYDSNNKRGSIFEKSWLDVKSILNKNVLFVDDIADSGYTLRYVDNAYKRYTAQCSYFTCVKKPRSIFTPTFAGTIVNDESWVNFPWET